MAYGAGVCRGHGGYMGKGSWQASQVVSISVEKECRPAVNGLVFTHSLAGQGNVKWCA
jgi:hypothetical protein